MKPLATLLLTLSAGAASAHPGHLAEAAGHNHWIGLAAIGAAVAVAVWAGLKGRKTETDDGEPEDEAEAEEQEA